MVRTISFSRVADRLISYVVKKHSEKESMREAWMDDDNIWAARTGSEFMMEDNNVDLAGLWESLGSGPQMDAQQREILELLTKAINEELTTRQRCALVRELQGWSAERIAMELGTSRGAVYKLTHDARKKLKEALEASGIDGDAIREMFSI